MRNITLAVEDDVLDKVRVVAAKNKTTVNALVRDYLSEVAQREDKVAQARKRLLQLIDTSEGRMAADYKFDREDSHER